VQNELREVSQILTESMLEHELAAMQLIEEAEDCEAALTYMTVHFSDEDQALACKDKANSLRNEAKQLV